MKRVLFALLGITLCASAQAYELSTLDLGGAASVKLNSLVQVWSIGNQVDSQFAQGQRLRRSEIKISGKIAGEPTYFLMVDPAKLIKPAGTTKDISTSTMIQDWGMSYGMAGFELTAGQFKIPTTAEGLVSSGGLPLPERSLIGRTLGDKREMGAKLAYKTAEWNATSMVSMARPVSVDGATELKDLITRVEATPMKDLGLGTFVTLGDFKYDNKGRWGVNARYRIADISLRAEYATAKDGGVHSDGTSFEAGYRINDTWEPVARIESYNTGVANNPTAHAQTLGVNYILQENVKVQAAGTNMQQMFGGSGSPSYSKGTVDRVLTVGLQAAI